MIRRLRSLFFTEHTAAPVVTDRYRPDIDGLRSVAILAVLGYHIIQHPMVSGGFVGVDLFFVISGYLISGILFSRLEQGRFSFADFYARRIRRIFPAAILVLASCLTAGWLLLLGAEYSSLGKLSAAGAAFVSNLVLWSETGYFDTEATHKALLHLWSLGIEEQFYIVLPVVMLIAWRLRLRFFWVFLLLFAASFAAGAYTLSYDRTAAFYAPYNRGWELMAGCLLCLLSRRSVFTPDAEVRAGILARARDLLRFAEGPVAVGLIAWPVLDYYGKTPFPGWHALPPVLAGCLLIHAGTRMRQGASWKETFWSGTLVNRIFLSNRPMVWIGLISYPLYLWHWPLWYFGNLVFPVPTPLIRWSIFGLSFLLAALTYWLIEYPVRHRYANRTSVVVCSVLMAVIAGFSLWVWRADGVPARFPAAYQKLWATYASGFGAPRAGWITRPDGLTQSAAGRPTVALIGDSHAHSLRNSFGDALLEKGEVVIARDKDAGLPLMGLVPAWKVESPRVMFAEAQAEYELFYRFLASPEAENVHTVVLYAYWIFWLVHDGDPMLVPAADKKNDLSFYTLAVRREGLRQALARTLTHLESRKVRVIFCVDNPRAITPQGSVQPLMYLPRPYLPVRHEPVLPREYHNKDVQLVMDTFKPVLAQHPAVQVYDPTPIFCDEKLTYMIRDGKLLLVDDNHMSAEASKVVAQELVTRFFSARKP